MTQVNEMTIPELKKEQENKMSKLFKDCGVFFAFDNKQFEQSKTPLIDGDKYVNFCSGGYLPKSNYGKLQTGYKLVDKWFNDQVNTSKEARYKHIAYELSNHEAYYTYDIEDTLSALGEGYTASEVYEVFNKEKVNHLDD